MVARLVRFDLGPGGNPTAEKIAARLIPEIEAQEGLHGVTFFGDDDTGEFGLFVLWESRDHAQAAAKVVGPQLFDALQGVARGEPDRRLFEVIEP